MSFLRKIDVGAAEPVGALSLAQTIGNLIGAEQEQAQQAQASSSYGPAAISYADHLKYGMDNDPEGMSTAVTAEGAGDAAPVSQSGTFYSASDLNTLPNTPGLTWNSTPAPSPAAISASFASAYSNRPSLLDTLVAASADYDPASANQSWVEPYSPPDAQNALQFQLLATQEDSPLGAILAIPSQLSGGSVQTQLGLATLGSLVDSVGVGLYAGGAVTTAAPEGLAAEAAAPSIEAQFQANSLQAATDAHDLFAQGVANQTIPLNPNLPYNLQAGNFVDDAVRNSNIALADDLGLDANTVQINQRLYAPDGSYRVPDLYFPQSGNIIDYSHQLKTINTPQIQGFLNASPNGTITIVPPAQIRPVYTIGP